MRKMFIGLAVALIGLFGCTMTVCAQPKDMGNGIIFDVEYYKQQNPDVVAVNGAEEAALFAHYVTYGKAEGRIPYSGGVMPALSNANQTSTGYLDVEAYNQFPKIYGQSYNEQIWSKSADFVRAVPSVWSGTADELIAACKAGVFKEETYLVTFPETGYGNTYSKFYNYTVTGKVKSCFKYPGGGKQLPITILFLENSHGVEFRVEVEPNTPFKVGEMITVKGYTDWWGGISRGVQLICGARNLPLYEW